MATNPTPNCRWAMLDPTSWPALAKLTAGGVICALVLMYGHAQQANYVSLATRYDHLASECLGLARQADSNLRSVDRQEKAIVELGRRLDRVLTLIPAPKQ